MSKSIVPVAVARSWPLLLSLGVHAALGTALAATRVVDRGAAALRVPERDIWIGETLEMPAPTDRAESPNDALPSDPQASALSAPAGLPSPRVPAEKEAKLGDTLARHDPPVDYAEKRADVPSRWRRGLEKTTRSDDPARARSLAERILAYEPGTRRVESEPTERGRGATGGMDATNRDVRGFAKAFTRALPAANTSDPIWERLPLGPVGSITVSVSMDGGGAIAESTVRAEPRKPPPYLARLVDRTLLLLQGGRFALTRPGRGTETLTIDVTLSEKAAESGPLALGFEAPRPGNPGRAYFQLSSGRLVDAKITIASR